MKLTSFLKSTFLSLGVLFFSSTSQAWWFNNSELIEEINKSINDDLRSWFPSVFDWKPHTKIAPVKEIRVTDRTYGQTHYIKYRISLFLKESFVGTEKVAHLPQNAVDWMKGDTHSSYNPTLGAIDVGVLHSYNIQNGDIDANMNEVLKQKLSKLSNKKGTIALTDKVEEWSNEWSFDVTFPRC